jgi:hypothetical protein
MLSPDGTARLDPPMETPIGQGDRLLAISADDDTVIPVADALVPSEEQLVEARPAQRAPERMLVLGWNRRGAAIARELDAYVPSGSHIVVAATASELASALMPEGELANATFEMREADPTRRSALLSLCAEGFDHVIVLCSDQLPIQRADARTLVTLINLRDIVAKQGHGFTITSEMLDLRNRALAEVTRADDFIVSDRLAGLLLSQLSENAHLLAVFDDLFDPAGARIYLRPMTDYVRISAPVTFATVVEATSRRGEIAIGYREAASSADASRSYGVVINPLKSRPITFAPDDKVIVLGLGD